MAGAQTLRPNDSRQQLRRPLEGLPLLPRLIFDYPGETMLIHRALRKPLFAGAFAALLFTSTARPAHATSKEIIEMQTQMQQLTDMVQRLQSTLDARFGVLQHLAEQSADDANRVTAAVSALQQKLSSQTEGTGGKLDAVSGQIQSLNDSVDELKSRINKLSKQLEEAQAQAQAQPQGAMPGSAAPSAGAAPAGGGVQAPPLKETFEAAVRDYTAGKLEVATGEFQDVLHYYPLDDLSGQAQFYLGEMAYRQQNYEAAVKSYNAVLEGFPGSPKAPAAQLRKGLALLQLNKRDAGIHELRALIARHPQSSEAAQARTKLNGLGVKIIGR